jgi:phage tail-like protein
MTDRASADGRTPDPVGELGFKVSVDDAVIGSFSECSGLTLEYEILEYDEGGENRFTHKLRGRLKHPNLVLKRGITHEDALLKWFFESKETSKRGAVVLEIVGADAKAVRTWAFAGALPVKWTGPTLNAGSANIATESLEIAHQGLVMRS